MALADGESPLFSKPSSRCLSRLVDETRSANEISKRLLTASTLSNRYPKESLSLSQTLAGFTLDGAHASFQEKRVGSLEVGKEADFIIIDRDFYEIVERNKRRIAGGEAGVLGEILETKVRATIVQGKLVFGSL